MDDPEMKHYNFFKLMSFTTTLVSLGFLVIRQYYYFIWQQHHFSNDTGIILFFKYKEVTSDPIDRYTPNPRSMYSVLFIVEFIIQAVQPIPYFDRYVPQNINGTTVYFFVSEYLQALMALRLF